MVMNESISVPCLSNEVVGMGSTPSHHFFHFMNIFFYYQVRVNTTVSFLHTVVLGNDWFYVLPEQVRTTVSIYSTVVLENLFGFLVLTRFYTHDRVILQHGRVRFADLYINIVFGNRSSFSPHSFNFHPKPKPPLTSINFSSNPTSI
jgi:hypothetical protein